MRKWMLIASGVAIIGVTVLVGQALTQDGSKKAAEGAVPQKSAKSRISRVTVYPDSALVTREVEVPEGSGLTELVVTNLPARRQQLAVLRGHRRHPCAEHALPHAGGLRGHPRGRAQA